MNLKITKNQKQSNLIYYKFKKANSKNNVNFEEVNQSRFKHFNLIGML